MTILQQKNPPHPLIKSPSVPCYLLLFYILKENRFSGLAQIDLSSLDITTDNPVCCPNGLTCGHSNSVPDRISPLGGNESSLRSVLDIHDSNERESQQRGKPKYEEYITTHKEHLQLFNKLGINCKSRQFPRCKKKIK